MSALSPAVGYYAFVYEDSGDTQWTYVQDMPATQAGSDKLLERGASWQQVAHDLNQLIFLEVDNMKTGLLTTVMLQSFWLAMIKSGGPPCATFFVRNGCIRKYYEIPAQDADDAHAQVQDLINTCV